MLLTSKPYYGWRRDIPDKRDIKFTVAPAVDLPITVDLRSKLTPVYAQGQLGSCTANAIAAHLDFNRQHQGEAAINPSRLFIYYNERKDQGTVSSDAGATIRESVKAVVKYGACPEAEWPYNVARFKTKPNKKSYNNAVKYEALTYRAVAPTVNDIKTCLAMGFPLVIGFTVYDSFENQAVATSGIMPMPAASESALGGHAVLVCGYTTLSDTPYWIVRNSWGAEWGDAGYFYMPEQYLLDQNLASDFWTLQTVK